MIFKQHKKLSGFSVLLALIGLYFVNVIASHANTSKPTLHIYQDADLVAHIEASWAIQQGIELAFNEVGNKIQGYPIAFKYLDHRGNTVRSKLNYQTFLNDPTALAIYSGIHSPPLIKNRNFINENQALTLVPWAAGGPITRHPSKENWVFRLSLDDTQAASVFVDFAVKQKQCDFPRLLLEKTPWGDSNLYSISQKLTDLKIARFSVSRFRKATRAAKAKQLLLEAYEAGNDCILFVGNATEGSVIVNEMALLDEKKRLPIISHWGITGGDFHEKVDKDKREKIDLSFIQTCFAFTNKNQPDYAKKVFKRLKTHTRGKIKKPVDLKSAVGFIHAYDLTKVLIQAMNQVSLTGDMQKDRDSIRLALENLRQPVQGLVKQYNKPFSVFDEKTNPNAHEALDDRHYCMGYFADNDAIMLVHK